MLNWCIKYKYKLNHNVNDWWTEPSPVVQTLKKFLNNESKIFTFRQIITQRSWTFWIDIIPARKELSNQITKIVMK